MGRGVYLSIAVFALAFGVALVGSRLMDAPKIEVPTDEARISKRPKLRCVRPTPTPQNYDSAPYFDHGNGLVVIGGSVAPYTPEAKRRKISGKVILNVELNCDGTVGAVEVAEGLPFGLSESAVEAARKLKFEMEFGVVRYEKLVYDFDVNKGDGFAR